MGKITKLATIVAKAARMEKKASDYKGKVAEMLNDINDPNPLMDYISESEAKEICEELDIPHEASWYKGDLLGYIAEVPDGMVDVLIEYISESDARSLWRNINSSKQNKLHKKAATMTKEEILEDIFQNNIEFDDENNEARLVDDKGKLIEIFELSKTEKDLRKQFDKYVEENDLLDDKYYYFEKNEQAKEEDAYLDSYDYLYSLLVNGNISLYKERLANMTGKEIVQYINWADEMGIDKAKLRLDLLK